MEEANSIRENQSEETNSDKTNFYVFHTCKICEIRTSLIINPYLSELSRIRNQIFQWIHIKIANIN